MKTDTQVKRIISYLEERGSITPVEAMVDLGVMRLSARISDIKKLGYKVVTETAEGENRYGEKTRYAKYILEDDYA